MSSFLIENLTIYNNQEKLVNLFDNKIKSLKIDSAVAIVGQSGSGKSLTLKTLLKLLPSNLKSNLKYISNFELNSSNISFVPQNPFTSLSPLSKIDKQFFCEKNKKIKMLKLVGLEKLVLDRFPSELSGGQLQRVVIAIAISTNPKLLLLDEPTTALDTKNKELILNLLQTLQQDLNILMLFVTHDILSIQNVCKNIVILKDGTIIETGFVKDILQNPKEDYTKQLILSSFKNRKHRK